MKLISPFKPLIKGGVVLTFKISAAGGENVQLDILPQGKDTATGVSLPPKALVGTPEEIDASLEEYLQKYAASVTRVADVVANAEIELKNIETAAAAQAKKTIDDKAKSKTSPSSKTGGKSAASAPRKDLNAGMLNEADDNGGDNDDDEGATTLITTGAAATEPAEGAEQAAAPAAAPAAAAIDGVSQDLFVV